MKTFRTDAWNPDFRNLVALLDEDLSLRDGKEHGFYARFNTLDNIRHAVVAYEGDVAVGCGAMKEFAHGVMEIKRMFTAPEHRGKGVAGTVLRELEAWAAALGCRKCVLETGKKQPEAIALYQKQGYRLIPNYGPYVGVENSVCFEKWLRLPDEETENGVL